MHRFLRPVVVVALLGCSDATEPLPPGPPPVFLVTPGQQWSGGVIAVRSAYFEGLSALPSFTIAQDTVTPTRLDDSTVSLALPQGPSGSVTVEVILADTVVSAGVVGRVGFRESRELLPALGGELHHVGTEILGLTYSAQSSEGRLGRVPLVAGTGSIDSSLRGTSEYWYGLSPTQVSGQYVLRDTSTQQLAVYDLVGGCRSPLIPFLSSAPPTSGMRPG